MTTETDELFTQIRTAHRLLAAYYQRLSPVIEQIAKELELEFYTWEPKEFSKPTQLTTNPLNNWQWDMLPALSTYYVFRKVDDVNKLKVGEYLVEILVDNDTGVKSDSNNGNQPDALALDKSVEEAESLLSICVYTPYEEKEANWYYNVWNKCEHPTFLTKDAEPTPEKDEGGYPIFTSGFKLPLSALLEENAVDSISECIKIHIDAALSSARSEARSDQLLVN